MIVMHTEAGDGSGMLILGVTKGNIDRLQTVNPISFHLPETMPEMKVRHVMILYGETKPAILQQCEAAGMNVDAYKAEAEANPL